MRYHINYHLIIKTTQKKCDFVDLDIIIRSADYHFIEVFPGLGDISVLYAIVVLFKSVFYNHLPISHHNPIHPAILLS